MLLFGQLIGQVHEQDRPSIHQRQSEFYSQLGLKTESEFDAFHQRKGGQQPMQRVTTCNLTHSVYGWYPYWIDRKSVV